MPDLSLYKVGVVVGIEDCGGKGKKTLRACRVNVGADDGEDEILTVVTAATNVREGSRLAVAPVGSTVLNPDGDDDDDEVVTVRKTSVGGVLSEGIFLDSVMLGWTGGAAGVAAQMPNSIPRGTAPPSRKPRPVDDGKAATESANAAADGGGGTDVGEGLFEKKLSKEEKKKLAEERRQARKAAKEAKNKES